MVSLTTPQLVAQLRQVAAKYDARARFADECAGKNGANGLLYNTYMQQSFAATRKARTLRDAAHILESDE